MNPGLLVAQSIRLVRPLGEGGMGSVWLAEHQALRTQVVVKFMSQELASDPVNRDRFTREAVAASQVKSPHVVQTFDHGVTADGVPFIVMELLEGEDLARRIRRGVLSPREAASVVTQVCRALTRAHGIGVVHRDIKPENIFLCDVGAEEPFVKLLDFGIAKSAANPSTHGQTRTGAMMGTPYYMSPEQFTGARDIDLRTDLWSLGVVAFECLTGARPFDADTLGGLAVVVHTAPLPWPSALRPGLPPAVDAWFARACARAPAERFQTARELGDAFAVAATGEALAQSSPGAGSGRPTDPALGIAATLPHTPVPTPPSPLMVTTGAGAAVESTTSPASPPMSRGPWVALALVAALVVTGVVVAVAIAWRAPTPAPAPAAVQSTAPATVDSGVKLAAEPPPSSSAGSATPSAGPATRPAAPPSSAAARPALPPTPTGKPRPSAADPFGEHVF